MISLFLFDNLEISSSSNANFNAKYTVLILILFYFIKFNRRGRYCQIIKNILCIIFENF